MHLEVLLTLLLSFLLPLPLLGHTTLTHLLLLLAHIGFFEPLLLHKGRIRLHIDRNYEGGKSVATDNAPIIHDILRCNFTVKN